MEEGQRTVKVGVGAHYSQANLQERRYDVTAGFFANKQQVENFHYDGREETFIFYPLPITKALRKLAHLEMSWWKRLKFLFNSRYLS